MTVMKKQRPEAAYWLKKLLGMTAKAHGRALSSIVLLVLMSSTCHTQEIVLIHGKKTGFDEQVHKVVDFYDLKVASIEVDSPSTAGIAIRRLRKRGTLGVLISQEALAVLDTKQVLAALRRPGSTIPILIFGIVADENSTELKLWSDGVIRACVPAAKDFRPGALKVEDIPTLARTLVGLQLPAVSAPTCTMQFEPTERVETALAAEGNGSSIAVLVRARSETHEIFFAPQLELYDTSWVGNPGALPQAFSSLAPFLLFLDHATGDYGWHLDGHYANLTIDDPWLIEPYGHLHYNALLEEMEKHNFHTTIAFIPWNHDRSKPEVVRLLRAHPERYSISIHGNNHTHREFGNYGGDAPWERAANLKQAIARMERFRALTGIPYDRLMIFPHAVASEATFAALKAFDFLGTANSLNVPAGAPFPTDPTFLLRPYTLSYGNILSLFRYSAEGQISRMEIAIQSFLGNPLLFYGHEKLFDNGIGEFNKFADSVNGIEPDTQWKSLGEIARHLYLVRRREDGGFDVRMFSNEMALRNQTQRDSVFHVEVDLNGLAAMPSLTIDDSPAVFERSGSKLTFRLLVPAAQVKRVRLHYQTEDVTAADVGDTGLYASTLRHASDFRDLYLSRFSVGRFVTGAYYQHGLDSLELKAEMAWRMAAAGLGVAFAGIWYIRRRTAGKKACRDSQSNGQESRCT